MWVNLLNNALKFTGTQPAARIEVGGRTENGATMSFVRDNGVGFDMRYGDTIFGVRRISAYWLTVNETVGER